MTETDGDESVETEPVDEIDAPDVDETETDRDDEIDAPDVAQLAPNDAADVATIERVEIDVALPAGAEPDDDDEIVDETETDIEPKPAQESEPR